MVLKPCLVLKEIFSGNLSTGELPPGYNSLFSPLSYSSQKQLGLNGHEFFINNTIDTTRSNLPYYFNDENDWKILFDTGSFGFNNKWIIVNESYSPSYKVSYISDGIFLGPEMNAWSGLKEGSNVGYSSNRLNLFNDRSIKKIYPPTGGEAYVSVKVDQSWIKPVNEFQNFSWTSGDISYFEDSAELITSSGIRITGLPSTRWIEIDSGLSLNKTYRVGTSMTGLPFEYNPYTGFWLDSPDNCVLYPAKNQLQFWFNTPDTTYDKGLYSTGWYANEMNGNIWFYYNAKIPRKGLVTPPNFDGPPLNIIGGTGSPVGDYILKTNLGPMYNTYYYSLNQCNSKNDQLHALPEATLTDKTKFPKSENLVHFGEQYIPGPKGWGDGSKKPPLVRNNKKIHVDQNGQPIYGLDITGNFWLGPYATGVNFLAVNNSEGISTFIISGGKTGQLNLKNEICFVNGLSSYKYPYGQNQSTYWEWLGFSYLSGYIFSTSKVPIGTDFYKDKWPDLYSGRPFRYSTSAYNSTVYMPGKALYSDWFPDFKIESIESQGPVTVFNPISGALQQDIAFNIDYGQLLPNYSMDELYPFEKGAACNVGYDPGTNKYLFKTSSGNYASKLCLDRSKEYRFLQTGYANQNKKLLIFSNQAESYTPNYSLKTTTDYHLIKINLNDSSPDVVYYSSADGLTTGLIDIVGRPYSNIYQYQYDPSQNVDADIYLFDFLFAPVDTLKWPDGSCCKNGPRYRTYDWNSKRAIYPNLQFRKGSWVSALRIDTNESYILNERMYFFTGNDPKSKYLFDISSGYVDVTHLDFPGVSFAGQIPQEPYKGKYWQMIQFYVPHNMPNNLNIKYGSMGTGYMPIGNWNSTVKIVENHNSYNVLQGEYIGNAQPIFSGNLILTSTDVGFSGRLPVILSGHGIVDNIKAFSNTTSAKTAARIAKDNVKINLKNI